jgi:hypothetical protein
VGTKTTVVIRFFWAKVIPLALIAMVAVLAAVAVVLFSMPQRHLVVFWGVTMTRGVNALVIAVAALVATPASLAASRLIRRRYGND